MLPRIFVHGHYLFPIGEQFSDSGPCRKTVSFEEQIMSKHKYLSMLFLCQMEVIMFFNLQIFVATHTVLKIGEYHLDIPTHLDQL